MNYFIKIRENFTMKKINLQTKHQIQEEVLLPRQKPNITYTNNITDEEVIWTFSDFFLNNEKYRILYSIKYVDETFREIRANP